MGGGGGGVSEAESPKGRLKKRKHMCQPHPRGFFFTMHRGSRHTWGVSPTPPNDAAR